MKKRELKFLVKKEKTITRQMQKLGENLPKLPQEEEETPDDTIEYTFENFFDRLNDSENRGAESHPIVLNGAIYRLTPYLHGNQRKGEIGVSVTRTSLYSLS